jgi:hypothetical protein
MNMREANLDNYEPDSNASEIVRDVLSVRHATEGDPVLWRRMLTRGGT